MKKVLLLFSLTLATCSLFSQKINEFHYDNEGGDLNEFVEVLLPPGANPTDFTLTLYNGSGGASYGTHPLSGFTVGDTDVNGTYYTKLISGIQNGAPDGIALDQNGTLVEFLSYEGNFTATNGPANGVMSTDIMVEESGTTLSTESLQRAPDNTWFGPSPNTLGGENSILLPTHLSSFTAKPTSNKTVTLDWSTASEENNAYFSIEHSTNGRDFISIDQVEGALSTTEKQYYNYQHSNAASGMNYYRLRQVDIDGAFTFSPIAAVMLASDLAVEVRPTLASTGVQVFIKEGLDKEATIEVYDVLGRLVISQVLERGTTQASIDINNLQKGHYSLKLLDGPETQISRFIKQ